MSWDVNYNVVDYDGSYVSWKKLGGIWSDEEKSSINVKLIDTATMTDFEAGTSYKFRIKIKKNGEYSNYI